MMFSLAPLLALAVASGVYAQEGGLTINTPIGSTVCVPVRLSWSGGTPPYFLRLLPGNQPGAAAIEDFGQQNGTFLTWNVNVPAGTSVGLTLSDSAGNTANSAAFTPNAGSNTDCLSTPASVSGGSAPPTTGSTSVSASSGAVTSVPSSPAGSPAPNSPAPNSPASSSVSRSASASAASTSASAKPNSASGKAVQLGFAGAVGAAVVALLA